MKQSDIIRDLLNWIESQLDKPLSLERISAKSGYSKWHIQRMFKNVTGQALFSYVRGRRLTRSALDLKFTKQTILNIAMHYHFDSQQTFTRAFKRKFNQTPGSYRRGNEWNTDSTHPRFFIESSPLPHPKFIKLPATSLIGIKQNVTGNSLHVFNLSTDEKQRLWTFHLYRSRYIPTDLYGLINFESPHESEGGIEAFYTTALEPHHVTDKTRQGQSFTLSGGDYALFNYYGPTDELQNFIVNLYEYTLPAYKLIRRHGCDIERFHLLNGTKKEKTPPKYIHCEYFIPIRIS